MMLPIKDSPVPPPSVSGPTAVASAPLRFSTEALSLLEEMPARFSLGQILEEAERRGGTARQGYLYLQVFIAAGWVRDEGLWMIKEADLAQGDLARLHHPLTSATAASAAARS